MNAAKAIKEINMRFLEILGPPFPLLLKLSMNLLSLLEIDEILLPSL
jgi:hypothetical protein